MALESAWGFILDILGSRATGNLFLLLAALSGFGLYWRRKRDRRERLRHALKAELDSMQFFEQWPNEFEDRVPSHSILSTKTYEANADDLGLLSSEEIKAVVEFYTWASIVQDMIDWDFQIGFRVEQIRDAQDTKEAGRKEKLRKSLDSLAVKHREVLDVLNENLD